MTGRNDRKPENSQALRRFVLLGAACLLSASWSSSFGQDKEAPMRFGDPEAFFESDLDATPTPVPSPEAAPTEAPRAADVVPSGTLKERVSTIVSSVSPGEEHPRQLQQLVEIGPAAVSTLIDFFSDRSLAWERRWLAAMALGRIGGDPAKETLEKGTADSLFLIRMASVKALALLGTNYSSEGVHKALSDPAMVVRSAAAEAAGKMKDKEAVPVLAKELFAPHNFQRGRSLWVRPLIVDALAEIGDASATKVLFKASEDHDVEIRKRACDGLLKLRGESCKATASTFQSAPPEPSAVGPLPDK